MESGVHSSLSSTCHHEIVFAKLNLKVEYPPPYERVFWYYSRADKSSINRAINAIDWEELFANKTAEFQVSQLNDLLLNICSNYIPEKTVLYDDKVVVAIFRDGRVIKSQSRFILFLLLLYKIMQIMA